MEYKWKVDINVKTHMQKIIWKQLNKDALVASMQIDAKI